MAKGSGGGGGGMCVCVCGGGGSVSCDRLAPTHDLADVWDRCAEAIPIYRQLQTKQNWQDRDGGL